MREFQRKVTAGGVFELIKCEFQMKIAAERAFTFIMRVLEDDYCGVCLRTHDVRVPEEGH